MAATVRRKKRYGILTIDPWLERYEGDIDLRMGRYKSVKRSLLPAGTKLQDFANGDLYYGFHRTDKGWVYREWAPGATAMHLIGDFNKWNRESHPMKRLENGVWEIELRGKNALKHRSHIKVQVTHAGGVEDHIPLYIHRVVQDPQTKTFDGQIWAPAKPYEWHDQRFAPKTNVPPIIYEAHIGMAQEKEGIGTYKEFTQNLLPRIKNDGYNTVQLMAIMEHPYYASFGYQVTNFFAASSWYGTPDDLKELIDTAHGMGLSVLLDLVHSHAAKNTAEGINRFDGTDTQFFLPGSAGNHPAWDSKLFDYGKHEVLHFLLSNLKFWLTEYHFDGFRFDGVTSMLYHDHGLGRAFDGYDKYFSMNTNVDAVTYLQLASELCHAVKRGCVLIAEDMSGMPGMCLPVKEGGLGFDYRLSMGVPDFWIKMLKERRDEDWDMGKMWYELTTRRPQEKNIGYCESHDQALVGDKTIMFWLADKEMYWGMNRAYPNPTVERAMALHKMIRLVTCSLAGEGYLNFMGNEFGHPEWIDFPREGNGWSFAHARRLWSLAEDGFLRYSYLGDFDKAMLALIKRCGVLAAGSARNLWQEQERKLLAFEKAGLIFLFNFHPVQSLKDFYLPVVQEGRYRVVLDSDSACFGGYERITHDYVYEARSQNKRGIGFEIYIPARTALVLERIEDKA